ncbi:MAG TPA: LamG-like jellyroll fold domain-containing protein, partial [Candidatus Acidoferrales bacterium]|nr:LamG-like jellyroll fold domain-containing protein [Candidatus Acidoferrales bacterium]
WSSSPLVSAAVFNGSSQYASLPNTISNYEDLSVTFWVNTSDSNPSGFPYGEFLVSRDISGYANDWNICLGQGRKIDFVTDADELVTPFDLNSNDWVQVACVADSIHQQKTLFINGQGVAASSWVPFVFANNSLPVFSPPPPLTPRHTLFLPVV